MSHWHIKNKQFLYLTVIFKSLVHNISNKVCKINSSKKACGKVVPHYKKTIANSGLKGKPICNTSNNDQNIDNGFSAIKDNVVHNHLKIISNIRHIKLVSFDSPIST